MTTQNEEKEDRTRVREFLQKQHDLFNEYSAVVGLIEGEKYPELRIDAIEVEDNFHIWLTADSFRKALEEVN